MKKEEFIQRCKENGLELTDHQIQQFEIYASTLKEWNEKMNLTAITEFEEVLDKHFYDSLLPSFSSSIKGTLCDVGTGAGFPSIPLKIAYPELNIVMIEPLGKRVTFLKEVVRVLELEHVECINARAEDYAKDHRECFDVVTARAVANLRMLSELCIPLVKKGGLFLAMKGSSGLEEDKEAAHALKTLGCTLEKTEERHLNDGSSRVNLFYRKTKSTPVQYPRQFAKIKKNPL
ncbi:MAG: 16S rRNA (guanine(527)-N(7))-methyltransferase RsmG [Erysipelotrichaceae bacterium]|nr:16S rRNA (guanine(527)-N(7))-methyltransferase RsmG [Erysipelotrichaceae bacterium]